MLHPIREDVKDSNPTSVKRVSSDELKLAEAIPGSRESEAPSEWLEVAKEACLLLGGELEFAAQLFRKVQQELQKGQSSKKYNEFGDAYQFRVLASVLLSAGTPIQRRRWATRPIRDPAQFEDPKLRLQEVQVSFGRLNPEQKLVLLFQDRHQIDWKTISIAMGRPVHALKFLREQGLRKIEDWVWEDDYSEPLSDARLSDKRHHLISNAIRLNEAFGGKDLDLDQIESLAQKRWIKTPWYVRMSAELAGTAALILFAIGALPWMHEFYQRSIESRESSLSVTEVLDLKDTELLTVDAESGLGTLTTAYDLDFAAESIALMADRQAPLRASTPARFDELLKQNESLQINDIQWMTLFPLAHQEEWKEERALASLIEKNSNAGAIKVGRSEIWRFIVKTDSPEDMRSRISGALDELSVPNKKPEARGLSVPGGIQYDFLVSKKMVPKIKASIQKIALKSTGEGSMQEPFTWFKRKKSGTPSGMSRVVIWLSQI